MYAALQATACFGSPGCMYVEMQISKRMEAA